jgi:uncharacterized protein (TIGR02099 family)
MPTPLRRRLRLARRGLWYVLAGGLVLMALTASVVSQLLPLAERHPDRIAAWLSERSGRTVTFDKVETQWTRRGPLLRLDAMRVGTGPQSVLIGDAEVLISQYAGLLPGRSFTELRLRGLDLTLEHVRGGGWSVHGLPGEEQQPSGDPFDTLEGLGELQVIGGKLTVIAPDLGIDVRLPRVDVRLRVDGDRVRAGARAWARGGRTPIEAVVDMERQGGDGRAWFALHQADLAAWSPLLHAGGVSVASGSGHAQAWAQLRRHRVAAVTVDAVLDNVRLRGAPLAVRDGSPRSSTSTFAQVHVRARWLARVDGWRLDAPTLRIADRQRTQVLDGLVVTGGLRYGLLADRVDAGPLFAVLALSDRIAPGVRRWLLESRPAARLENIVITGRRGGAMHASGRVADLSFAAVGDHPGISGLGGAIDGDQRGVSFRFDERSPLRFDWPRGFGVPHVFAMRGNVVGWRDAGGWRVATPGLRLASPDVTATVRGGLSFVRDASPRIDLVADLDDVPVVAAKGFWVRHLMAPVAVHWLDTAVQGGTVHAGRAVISGALADWPFNDGASAGPTSEKHHTGMFAATAQVRGALLKFDPQWPVFDHVDADVAFVGDGFSVSGQGVLAGVGIRHFDGGIAHFGEPDLVVRAQGGGDASRLLALLKQSPLHGTYGDTLDNIVASGLADVTFGLDLPLHGSQPSTIEGTVALAGAKLAEKRWDIAFDNVRGSARYGGGGFEADRLAVVHDGQPGRLSLRAGDFTRDRRQAFEAGLDATIEADDLLQRAPQLAWLKPYLSGRSAWTVGVAIPRSGKGAASQPSQLQLRSDLLGTTLDLPAPLRKPAGIALPATIAAALPLGDGDTTVSLGNVVALRAHGGRTTGVRVALGGPTPESAPVSGLSVAGHASTLDALDWVGIAKGGTGSGNTMPLRDIDISADRLLAVGSTFPGTRLQVRPTAGGLAVQVQGDALAGTVRIPDADGAMVTGQFQRVYWRGASTGNAAGGSRTISATKVASTNQDVDPAKVPPLSLDIGELRFGDARLGTASLRTHPLANGMRIDQLQTRSPTQRLDINGDWLGRGGAARTRMASTVESEDFGALLSAFGYGGQLSGGHGKARLDASWPGSPAAFGVSTLTGTLGIAAREGQLVEVEPGAGRVLGLLSIAQLPRRLALDFHDLFSKGFAFDRIEGDVHVEDGVARSDNLVIDGPAAEIRIHGAANLVAQEFDQTIDVFPKAGNLLTVAGAIAGGPVGAAIGAAANAVLKKPLGRLAAKTYRVTGPWKEPKVEIISREQSRLEESRPAKSRPPAG